MVTVEDPPSVRILASYEAGEAINTYLLRKEDPEENPKKDVLRFEVQEGTSADQNNFQVNL